jgi:glycosidase
MNNKTPKLMLNLLMLSIVLACSSCGKSSTKPDTTVVVTPPTKSTDPAQYGTPYANVLATKDIVMYEVNIKTFTPANFAGVKARLNAIKAMGVNVIWLMPTYPIGILKGVGSPYSVKDYEGVNADFGSLDDLRSLVAQAHTLGMAVILDWEANDTSWDNAWITEHPSWYLQDGSGNIIMPPGTNYADVAALNFNNSDMRAAMIKAMKYWVFTANIDGYRCDFADNVTTDFWTQAIDTLKTITTHNLIYLAEGTKGAEISSGFQISYAFSYYSTLKSVFAGSQSPSALFTTNSTENASLPSPGIKLRYITNHDDASSDGSTITEYKGKQGALAAFVATTYMGGIPLIYSSQEVGYPNTINFFNTVPVDYTANPDMVAEYTNILAFRAAHEAVKTGTLTQFDDANVIAFEKKAGSDDVLILVNARNTVASFTVPAAVQGGWTNGLANASVTLGSTVSLQPYAYLVLKR